LWTSKQHQIQNILVSSSAIERHVKKFIVVVVVTVVVVVVARVLTKEDE